MKRNRGGSVKQGRAEVGITGEKGGGVMRVEESTASDCMEELDGT